MVRKKQFQCQIIYDINLDRKDVVLVIAIFILKKLTVFAVQLDFEQNQEVREYGNSNVLIYSNSKERD